MNLTWKFLENKVFSFRIVFFCISFTILSFEIVFSNKVLLYTLVFIRKLQ